MENFDELLKKIYYQGFNDSFDNLDRKELLISAYTLGWLHSIIGDDVRSVDNLSWDEILELIYNKNQNKQ